MLTPEQLAHYETFGFIILRQVFTAAELATIEGEFERGLDAAFADEPFDGSRRHGAMMLGPNTPFFAHLPEDPRFYQVAEQLYGADVFGMAADANRYVGDTRWHPDHGVDPTEDCYGVKFAYYLDPVDGDSGALRLIPGSHREPYHSQLKESLATLELAIADVPAYVCTSQPGDVVAFDMRCWHASCGGVSGRRMCTVVFYNNPQTPEEEAAARHRGRRNAASVAPKGLYDPHWIANHEGNPKRQAWIDRMDELGYFEPGVKA